MTPHYADDWLTVYHGDSRAVMAEMEPESVHCVVTSPPYWGLRDYGDTGQLGLEPTPETYVANMVAVFREVRRVLRSDGTVWLNLGDSYAGSGPNSNADFNERNGHGSGQRKQEQAKQNVRGYVGDGLKPKDLVGIPWRVAFALQADGWYLRSDIIWSKPNPMPESVTDRPTKSHEYLFLLSKSPRYYFDADAVREDNSDLTAWVHRKYEQRTHRHKWADEFRHKGNLQVNGRDRQMNGRNIRSVWEADEAVHPDAGRKDRNHYDWFMPENPAAAVDAYLDDFEAKLTQALTDPFVHDMAQSVLPIIAAYRAARTPDYSSIGDYGEQLAAKGGPIDAATEALILEGQTSPGPSAGAPLSDVWTIATAPYPGAHFATFPPKLVEPCIKAGCPEGGVVLDPFAGSGTTGMVAQNLSRKAVLIDLSMDYLGQLMKRNRHIPMGLGS